jgi:hypothetical protein
MNEDMEIIIQQKKKTKRTMSLTNQSVVPKLLQCLHPCAPLYGLDVRRVGIWQRDPVFRQAACHTTVWPGALRENPSF